MPEPATAKARNDAFEFGVKKTHTEPCGKLAQAEGTGPAVHTS